jgi:hypothetical protein
VAGVVNYSAWQNEIAKTSSLLQLILVLQVCSVQIVVSFTFFELQKIDKFIETPVSTMALHSGHLIKRRGIFFHLFELLFEYIIINCGGAQLALW